MQIIFDFLAQTETISMPYHSYQLSNYLEYKCPHDSKIKAKKNNCQINVKNQP